MCNVAVLYATADADLKYKLFDIEIEQRNLQQLTDSILYMAENSQNYDPEILQAFGEKEFSPEIICQKTYDVYRQALKQWPAGNQNKYLMPNRNGK